MGLIREIQGITATINKQERTRRERERQKILIDNYNAELFGDLRACFYQAFKCYQAEEAEQYLLEQKEQNINKIVEEIESITYTDNKKEYYTYKGKFDIYTDVTTKYYTELQKFKKEYYQLKKLQQKAEQKKQDNKQAEYTTILYNKLLEYYIDNKNNLIATSNTLHKFENIEIIIDDITNDNQIKHVLCSQYITILNNVEKLFKFEIQQEKEHQKQYEHSQKIKKVNKIKKDISTIYMLKKLNKFLKQNRTKKRRQ